jgi:threonine dehydrogenase-like Zn-dependent dehydrogenase
MKGDVPTVANGTTLGHEGVGIIEEVGPAVSSFKQGDRVLISCITSCGRCEACRKGMYSHCENGGWILGSPWRRSASPAPSISVSIVAAGGHIANVGVHGKSVELKLAKLWAHNVTITTRLVDGDNAHAAQKRGFRQPFAPATHYA